MDPLLSRITIDPAVCHGKPCVRGLCCPVEALLELLSSGMTHDEVLSDYEDLEPDDLLAVLAYAARLAHTRHLLPLGPRGGLTPLPFPKRCWQSPEGMSKSCPRLRVSFGDLQRAGGWR